MDKKWDGAAGPDILSGSEEKDKVSLTAEQVKRLYEYEFETPSLRMSRDFWMLSFRKRQYQRDWDIRINHWQGENTSHSTGLRWTLQTER